MKYLKMIDNFLGVLGAYLFLEKKGIKNENKK